MGGLRSRRFFLPALTGGFLGLAAYDFIYWLGAFRSAPLAQDASIYYVAAQIGVSRGWDRIYDLGLQARFFARLHAGIWDPSFFSYSSPPPLAWLMAPLTVIPPLAAYLVVVGLSIAALVGAAALAAPAAGRLRILFVMGAAAWYPVAYTLRLGQVTLLVGALIVLSGWLERRGRPELAGGVLALAAIKPQLALLVAPCLLIAGRRRLFASWLVGTALLVVVSVLSLGGSGIGQYAKVLAMLHAAEFNQHFTLAALGAGPDVTIALQALAAIATLAVAYRRRQEGTETVIAVALVGGLLVAPYLHVEDFAVLAPAAWLLLREGHPIAPRAWLVSMAVTMELAWVLGPLPILASLAVSLLLFCLPRAEPRPMALAA